MIYAEQLAWLIQRFNLNEEQAFSLDMHIHFLALQMKVMLEVAASRLIDSISEQDATKPVLESFQVTLSFTVDEWQEIQAVFEKMRGRNLSKDEIIDAIVLHGKDAILHDIRKEANLEDR